MTNPLEPRVVRPTEPIVDTSWLTDDTWQAALIVPLLPADRCDRCTSQAHVRVRRAVATDPRDDTRLDFCGHHYHEHELALMAAGWHVEHDTRETLLHRPGASA